MRCSKNSFISLDSKDLGIESFAVFLRKMNMRLSDTSYFLALLVVILLQHVWYVGQLDSLQKGSQQSISVKCECPAYAPENLDDEDLEVMCTEIENLGYIPRC